jgi:glycosyltransferase involved in cell wall biosynthesis
MLSKAVTVVLVAFERKDFIVEAINSVLAQSLDKSFYELIVVKNFVDEDIDDLISKQNIICINSDITGLGGKLYQAISLAHGSIISFLEDDDLFFDNKLEEVVRIFSSRPDILFYHNSAEFIDSTGRRTGKRRSDPGFNISCMSMKREAIYMECLRSLRNSVDLFLFCNGVDQGNTRFYYDNSTLTFYRLHNSSSNTLSWSFDEYLNTYINQPQILTEDIKIMFKCIKSRTVKWMLQDRLIRYKIEYVSALLVKGEKVTYDTTIRDILRWLIYPYHLNSIRKYPLKLLFTLERYSPTKVKRTIIHHFYLRDTKIKSRILQ